MLTLVHAVDSAPTQIYRNLDLAANIEAARVFRRDEKVAWRCRNIGYLNEGNEATEKCPACDPAQAHFELLGENY